MSTNPLTDRKGTMKPNSKAVSAGKQEAAFKDRSISGPKKPVINRDASNVKAAHSPSAVVQRPT
ncbi:hypothetical protein R0J90_21090, partial [Micrococcus sp. SIMBA_144]